MHQRLGLVALLATACLTAGPADDKICVGEDCVDAVADSEPPADTEVAATPTPTPTPVDTGSFPELCNGIDDDNDGEIDEDPIDGELFFADLDGDGFGDLNNPIRACELREGLAESDSDCNDGDEAINPLAPDVANGSDDDCDGRIDEVDVAFLAASQCTSSPDRAAATDLEVAEIEAFLLELGLTMSRYDAVPGGSLPAGTDLSDHSLVFYTKCGWSWASNNLGDVDVIAQGTQGEAALFVFGDDMAFGMASVPAAEPYVMLAPTTDNGTSAQLSTMVFDSSSTHPAYAGPYGTPVDYSYAWDMDRSSVSTPGAITLATHDTFGSPVFIVWEDPVSHRRQATLLASVYNANHGSPGSAARVNGEIVFKNIVSWLLRI